MWRFIPRTRGILARNCFCEHCNFRFCWCSSKSVRVSFLRWCDFRENVFEVFLFWISCYCIPLAVLISTGDKSYSLTRSYLCWCRYLIPWCVAVLREKVIVPHLSLLLIVLGIVVGRARARWCVSAGVSLFLVSISIS